MLGVENLRHQSTSISWNNEDGKQPQLQAIKLFERHTTIANCCIVVCELNAVPIDVKQIEGFFACIGWRTEAECVAP